MFRHTLMLLVTTVVLGSLAEHEFFKGRRNNYNSNANSNIFGGYENALERDMDRIRDRGYGDKGIYEVILGNPRFDSSSRDTYDPGFANAPKYRSVAKSGLDKNFISIDDDRFRGIGELCDENPRVVPRKGPFYRDDDEREDSRLRSYRPYGYDKIINDANSNANNNAIGMRYRRVLYWGDANPMAYPDGGMYDGENHGTNMNTNANTNVVGGRRSNINSNVNTNGFHQYEGRGRVRAPERRDRYAPSMGNSIGERVYGSAENNKPRGYPKKPVASKSFWPSYLDQEEEDEEEDPPGYDSSPLQSDGNMNYNTNTNIIGRRSNTNANKNSNVFSRTRRSVADRTRRPSGGVKGVAEIGEKNLAVAENWENARGPVNRGLV